MEKDSRAKHQAKTLEELTQCLEGNFNLPGFDTNEMREFINGIFIYECLVWSANCLCVCTTKCAP